MQQADPWIALCKVGTKQLPRNIETGTHSRPDLAACRRPTNSDNEIACEHNENKESGCHKLYVKTGRHEELQAIHSEGWPICRDGRTTGEGNSKHGGARDVQFHGAKLKAKPSAGAAKKCRSSMHKTCGGSNILEFHFRSKCCGCMI